MTGGARLLNCHCGEQDRDPDVFSFLLDVVVAFIRTQACPATSHQETMARNSWSVYSQDGRQEIKLYYDQSGDVLVGAEPQGRMAVQ